MRPPRAFPLERASVAESSNPLFLMSPRFRLTLVLHAGGGRHRGRWTSREYPSLCRTPTTPPGVRYSCRMTRGLCQSHTGSESSSNSRKEMLPKPITIVTSESSSTCFVRSEEFSFGSGHAVTTQTPAQVAVLTPSGPLYPCVTSPINSWP